MTFAGRLSRITAASTRAAPRAAPGRFLADGLAELVAPFPQLAGHTTAVRTPAPPADTAGVTRVAEWSASGPRSGKGAGLCHALPTDARGSTATVSACSRRVTQADRRFDWRELPAERQCPDCHVAVLSAVRGH